MSSKENIKNILEKTETLDMIIDNLPVSTDNIVDTTNLSVWWILNKEDKENLLKLLYYYEDSKLDLQAEEIEPILKKEIKKIWIKMLRFIDSLWTHRKSKINNWEKSKLLHNMTIPWIALEYFLIDSISRLYNNSKVQVEKWPSDLEWKKVDFVLNCYENLKLWIQLTLSEWSSINEKRNDIYNLRNNINDLLWLKNQEKHMSSKYIVDAPVFMIINSETSRQTHNNNILLIAFKKWQESWFPAWWPSVYLEQKIQKELKKIWFSLPSTISKAMIFIKEIYKKWETWKYQEIKINNLHLVYDWEKIKVLFFNKERYWKSKSNFIYSIEIFITDKLVEKLWV